METKEPEQYIVRRHTHTSPTGELSSENAIDEDTVRFLNWMLQVEKIVYSQIGFTLNDLPDELYGVNFEDGMTSEEMASIVLDDFDKYKKFLFGSKFINDVID